MIAELKPKLQVTKTRAYARVFYKVFVKLFSKSLWEFEGETLKVLIF